MFPDWKSITSSVSRWNYCHAMRSLLNLAGMLLILAYWVLRAEGM